MASPRARRHGWTVRSRLMLGICLVVAFGIAAAGSIAFLIERAETLTALDAHLTSRVAAARSIVLGPAGVSGDGTPVRFTSTRAAAQAVVAGIVPDSGESTFATVDGKLAFIPGVRTTARLDRDRSLVVRVASETAGGRTVLSSVTTATGVYRYAAAPITVSGDTTRAVFVMGSSVDLALASVYAQARTFAMVGLVTFLVITALGWFVSGRLLLPIVALTRTAERITSRDRSERVAVRGDDDLSRLGRVVNGMLDRLDAELVRQRQLLDDVRHELNTPLTIVRGHLEILDVRDPVQVEATRELSLDELSRMSRLVADLTRLAESVDPVLELERTDVAELATAVHSKAAALGGHPWQLAPSDHRTALLDRSRVSEAWLQLLENAGKYAPPGSAITLGATGAGDEVELWVLDEGPGVPPEARERIFERFGRVTSNRGIEGSGLGLPIVRAIARAHGGDVRYEPVGAGSRFVIAIPLDGPESRQKGEDTT